MNSINSITLQSFIALSFILIIGCKKYEENDNIALTSAASRLKKEWRVDKVYISDILVYDNWSTTIEEGYIGFIYISHEDILNISSMPKTYSFKRKIMTQGEFELWEGRMNMDPDGPAWDYHNQEYGSYEFEWTFDESNDAIMFEGISTYNCGISTCVAEEVTNIYNHNTWTILKLDRDELVVSYEGSYGIQTVEVRVEMVPDK